MFALKKDWFTPNWRRAFPPYAELRDEIEREIRRSIGNGNSDLSIESLRFVMEENQYNKIKGAVLEIGKTNPNVQALLTYHSTSDVDKLDSIIRYGYILPGQEHPTQGWTLRMRNGNAYGDGIYCSPRFDISKWYSFVDFDGALQLIVNILVPGETLDHSEHGRREVQDSSQYTENFLTHDRHRGIYVLRKYHYSLQDETRKGSNENHWRQSEEKGRHFCLTKTEECVYHTLRSHDMSVWVAGSPDRIVPVAVVTLRPNTQGAAMKKYLKSKDCLDQLIRMARGNKPATFFRFGQDTYLVSGPERTRNLDFSNSFTLLVAAVLSVQRTDEIVNNTTGPLCGRANTPQKMLDLGDSLRLYLDAIDRTERTCRDIVATSRALLERHGGAVPLVREDLESLPGVVSAAVDVFWDIACNDPDLEEYEHTSSNVLRHYFVVPPSLMTDRTFATAVSGFLNGFDKGEKHIALCGTDIEIVRVINQETVSQVHNSTLNSMEMEKSTREGDHLVRPLGQLIGDIVDENCNDKYINIIYMVINQPRDLDQIDSFVEKWKIYLQVKMISVKLLFAGSVHPEICRLKSYIQTMPTSSPNYFFKIANLEDDLNAIFDEVEYEYRNFQSFHLSIPFPCGVIGEGFTKGVKLQPSWDVTFHKYTLFKGCPPEFVTLHKHVPRTCFTSHNVEIVDSPSEDHLESFCHCVFQLLASFQNFLFQSPDRIDIYRPLIEDLAAGMLLEIEKFCGAKMYSVSVVKGLKHKLLGFLSSITTFGGILFKGKWYDNLVKMKFGKKVAQRVKKHFDLQKSIQCVPRSLAKFVNEPSDCLQFVDRTGRPIRVRITPASEIEPWLIQVEYVSLDQCCSSKEMFVAGEEGRKVLDSRGRTVTDVVLLTVQNDDMAKLYHGYVFTKTPYLYMPSQHPSLVVNSMNTCIETAFRLCVEYRHKTSSEISSGESAPGLNRAGQLAEGVVKEVQEYVDIAFGLLERARELMCTSDMMSLVERASTEGNPEMLFTESFGVLSINQFLVALMLPEAAALVISEQWPRVCFALLAEAVMRNCRARVRSGKRTAEELIDRCLFINPNLPCTSYQRNIKRSSQTTNAFMTHSYSNCSPFKTVGVLYFIKYLHMGKAPRSIADAFADGVASMGSFLRDYLPGYGGYITQLALYLQGMNCLKAKLRHGIRFDNPRRIVDEIINARLQHHDTRRMLRQRSVDRQARRLMIRTAEAEPYRVYHSEVILFTKADVDRINQDRPAEERLELMTNGLLRHHCCCPNCPDFLRNLQTRTDRKRGTRFGIMNHMRHDILLGIHAKSWHLNCWRNSRLPLDKFLVKMKELYPHYRGCEEVARAAYQQYQALRSKKLQQEQECLRCGG